MDALDFLRLVLPPEGPWYIGLALKPNENNPDKPFRRQQAVKNIEELHAWLTTWNDLGWTVYYACASFKNQRLWNERDQQYHQRSHDNINQLASFFCDVDSQETHPNAKYKNVEEAARATGEFCRVANLPPPLWIASGGGLYTIWPFRVCLPFNLWRVYSTGLKFLAEKYNFHIDPVRTADGSSVLRPPGSLHQKADRIVEAGPPVERYDLALFEHLKEVGNAERRITAPPVKSDSALTRALLDSERPEPSDPRTIANYCGQINQLRLGPGTASEPIHYAVAGLFAWCGPGGPEFHDSIIDPEYREAAKRKREQWGSRFGPPLCSYFHDKGKAEICEACAFWPEKSSPIVLGRLAQKELRKIFGPVEPEVIVSREIESPAPGEAPAPTPQNGPDEIGFPKLEPPWALNDKQQIVFRSEDDEGGDSDTVVSEHMIYVDHVHTSETNERSSYTIKHYLPKEAHWTTINVDAEDMGNGRGIPELLAKRVLVCDERLLKRYLTEQLGEFQRNKISSMRFEQFGWKHNDTRFLAGARLYSGDGVFYPTLISDSLKARARLGIGPAPGGSVRDFVALITQLFRPDHYCAWFNILASFGAIFQHWHSTTEGGILLSNYTADSGKGKTKLLNAAAAIWGQWDAFTLKHYDTQSSQGLILAELCNLPGFIDEFAHFATDPKYGILRLRTFVDMFGAGTDRHRALAHGIGVRSQLGRWAMNVLTTSNRPVIEILEVFAAAETAPLKRLWECDASPPANFDPWLGEGLERAMWANAGWAGDAFLQHLMSGDNLECSKAKLRLATEHLWRKSGLIAEHRFRIRLLSDVMLAASLTQDCGLVPASVKIDEVIEWAIEQINIRTPSDTRAVTSDISIDALNKFLTDNANNTLRVQSAYKSGQTQIPFGALPQRLVIRYEAGLGRAFIVARDFKRFLVTQGYPATDILKNLEQIGVIKNINRSITLGAGTEYVSAQAACIEIDIAHPVLSQTLREASNVEMRNT